jgi:hypothetical protein
MVEMKDRSEHWLMRAMEAHTMAEKMAHHHTRSTLLMIASEYLHLSDLAEQRERWLKPEAYISANN